MNFRELVVVVPLIGLCLFLGIYPKPVLDRIEPAAEQRNRELRAQDRLPQPRARGATARRRSSGKSDQEIAKQAREERK